MPRKVLRKKKKETPKLKPYIERKKNNGGKKKALT